MKMKFKFLLLAGLLGFSACTNELSNPNDNKVDTIQLVKAPEIYAYSGNQVIGTRSVTGNSGNNGDGATGNATWDQFVIPGNITEAERANVLEALEEKTTGRKIDEGLVLPWENYFLQDVVSAVDTDTPSKSYQFEAYNKGAECDQKNWPGTDYEDYSLVTNNGQISSYYQDRTTSPQTRIDKTALMTNMEVGTYDEMNGKQFRWFINCHENLHWSNYIFVQVDGFYYICFDFACGYLENDVDGNPGRGNTQNDWDYNDWIIKITPAIPVDDPKKDFPVWNGPSNGNQENTISKATEHIEINLSIEEREDVEWLASHLSIHVRANTDVEVFIPLPAKFYCAVDDMAIVAKHDVDYIHAGPKTATFTVEGEVVSMTVAFEDGGIRVTTDGINENVISYLKDTYGDGLTFEVWNYMNLYVKDWSNPELAHGQDVLGYGQENEITVEELREYLNGSTVTFTNQPTLYVNAFMYQPGCKEDEHTCGAFIDDCIVSPGDIYSIKETGYWYNGSPYNKLYH